MVCVRPLRRTPALAAPAGCTARPAHRPSHALSLAAECGSPSRFRQAAARSEELVPQHQGRSRCRSTHCAGRAPSSGGAAVRGHKYERHLVQPAGRRPATKRAVSQEAVWQVETTMDDEEHFAASADRDRISGAKLSSSSKLEARCPPAAGGSVNRILCLARRKRLKGKSLAVEGGMISTATRRYRSFFLGHFSTGRLRTGKR